MIINESNQYNREIEFDIVDIDKFISSLGGIMDSGMRESKMSREDRVYRDLKNMLDRNKMSYPPKPEEIRRANYKIKVPWFLVGLLSRKAIQWGLARSKE